MNTVKYTAAGDVCIVYAQVITGVCVCVCAGNDTPVLNRVWRSIIIISSSSSSNDNNLPPLKLPLDGGMYTLL